MLYPIVDMQEMHFAVCEIGLLPINLECARHPFVVKEYYPINRELRLWGNTCT